MDSKHRGIIEQDLPIIRQSSGYSYLTDQAHRPSYMEPDFRQTEQGCTRDANYFNHPHPYPFEFGIHESIRREMDKERIRQDIILAEIARRRVLEAEVRMEMMLERDLAQQGGSNVLPFGLSSVMGFDTPMRPALLEARAERCPMEERLGRSFEDKEKLKGRSHGGGFGPLQQYHRGTADLRIPESMPTLENGKQKERIVIHTKPDKNISGSKRKAATPPEADDDKLPFVISNKISKKEWSCSLCQISATSEKTLNSHLGGKKHRSNEAAALRAEMAERKYSIGLLQKKATESIHVGKIDADKVGVKLTSQSLLLKETGEGTSKKDGLPLLQQNPKSDNKKKKISVVGTLKGKKKDESKKANHKFWCELCNVGTLSLEVMNNHKRGKKHVKQLQRSERNGGAGTSNKRKKIAVLTGGATVAKTLKSDNAGKDLDEVKAEDHKQSKTVKPNEGMNLDLANLKKNVDVERRLEDQELVDADNAKHDSKELISEHIEKALYELMFGGHKLVDGLKKDDKHDITKKEKSEDVNICKKDDGFYVGMTNEDDGGKVNIINPKYGLSNDEDDHKDDKQIVP